MKRIAVAILLFVAVSVPAVGYAGSAGVNFSLDGAFGIQGESRISSDPISIQGFYKQYSQNIAPGVSWGTSGIGAAGIYDFSSAARVDRKFHPYVGAGLILVTYRWTGTGPAWAYTGVGSGLYLVGGVRYFLTRQMAADFNFNSFGGLTAGLNFYF